MGTRLAWIGVTTAAIAALGILSPACGSSSKGGDTAAGTTPDAAGIVDPGAAPPDGAISGADAAPSPDAATGDDAALSQEAGSIEAGVLDAGVDAAPPDPAVRFVGRFDKRDANGPRVGWPGARIVARFTGTAASVTLFETAVDGTSRWDVRIDGGAPTVLATSAGLKTYPLAAGLAAAGVHQVDLERRTEAEHGVTQFRGFTFTGGVLQPPPATPSRRIEFIGDSNLCGYGIEGAGPICTASAANENERKSTPALVGTSLSADVIDVCYSGRGIYQNVERTNPDTMPVIYPRILPDDATSLWSFAEFTPDVVWVQTGNDWDQPNAAVNDPPPNAAYKTKYDAFLTTLRAKYPAAHLFIVMASTVSNDYPTGYNAYTNMKAILTSLVTARTAGGDTKIYYFEYPVRANNPDLTACDYHPSPAYHVTLAGQVTAAIKAKTGW